MLLDANYAERLSKVKVFMISSFASAGLLLSTAVITTLDDAEITMTLKNYQKLQINVKQPKIITLNKKSLSAMFIIFAPFFTEYFNI